MKLTKLKINKILALSISIIISGYGCFAQNNICYSNHNKGDLIRCGKYFNSQKKITDDIVVQYSNDYLYKSIPNLIKVINNSLECIKIYNGKIFSVSGDSTLFVIIPDKIEKKLLLYINERCDTVEFNVRLIPQANLLFSNLDTYINAEDSICLSQIKDESRFSLKISPKGKIEDKCLLNYFNLTYSIVEIKLLIVRKDKVYFEEKGKGLSELIRGVKGKVRKRDFIVIDVDIQVKDFDSNNFGSKVAFFRIKVI